MKINIKGMNGHIITIDSEEVAGCTDIKESDDFVDGWIKTQKKLKENIIKKLGIKRRKNNNAKNRKRNRTGNT